jgi:molecular chaperone DnaK (HSP70)
MERLRGINIQPGGERHAATSRKEREMAIRVWIAEERLSTVPQTALKIGSFLQGMKHTREEIQRKSFEAFLLTLRKEEEK